MKLREMLKNKDGFTLVEIIAVLVILAILAVVAVPKYFSLTADAQDKAMEGALAEGMSVCSLAYGRVALQSGAEPTVAAVVTEASAVNIAGDFTFTFAAAAGDILITATGIAGSPMAGEVGTKTWVMP